MTRTFPGDLLCVRAGALPHPDNKLSVPPVIRASRPAVAGYRQTEPFNRR